MGSTPAFTTDRIRNIVVLGHGGSGKTTLVDACCHAAGSSRRHGSTTDGTPVLDPEVTTPEAFVGEVIGDLNQRGGRMSVWNLPEGTSGYGRSFHSRSCSATRLHFGRLLRAEARMCSAFDRSSKCRRQTSIS